MSNAARAKAEVLTEWMMEHHNSRYHVLADHFTDALDAFAAEQTAALTRERELRDAHVDGQRSRAERAEALAAALRAALDLPLLFHSGGPWDDAKRLRWLQITGTDEATTRVMGDTIRTLLAGSETPR